MVTLKTPQNIERKVVLKTDLCNVSMSLQFNFSFVSGLKRFCSGGFVKNVHSDSLKCQPSDTSDYALRVKCLEVLKLARANCGVEGLDHCKLTFQQHSTIQE